jgi:poly(A) polymerase
VLRSASGEAPGELSQWWEKFQQAGEAERQAMLLAPQPGDHRRRRRRRRRKSALPPPAEKPASQGASRKIDDPRSPRGILETDS